MGRKRKDVPTLQEHKASGLGVVYVYNATGTREPIYFEKYGTPECRASYIRFQQKLATTGNSNLVIKSLKGESLSIAEMVLEFLVHAKKYYFNHEGGPGHEIRAFKMSCRELRELYDHTPASAFDSACLEAVRDKMVENGLSLGVINQRIGRIVAIFRRAAKKKFVPSTVWSDLKLVEPLEPGHTEATHYPEVEPISDEHFRATLPYCSPAVAALLCLVRMSGARPGELCRMRPIDLRTIKGDDGESDIVTFTPRVRVNGRDKPAHKTSNRGHKRVIRFGPKAQLILKHYLDDIPFDERISSIEFVFSPQRERIKRMQDRRIINPDMAPCKSQANPKSRRTIGERFSVDSLSKSIKYAVVKANEAKAAALGIAVERLKPYQKLPHWYTYQLRHSFGTEARRVYGLEWSQVGLGHKHANVSEIYAARDELKGMELARGIG